MAGLTNIQSYVVLAFVNYPPLLERRREMLKRAGNNIEDMTRKALRERPEDPRTAQLRKELEELRRAHEMETMETARPFPP